MNLIFEWMDADAHIFGPSFSLSFLKNVIH